jgi:hypothetical protein
MLISRSSINPLTQHDVVCEVVEMQLSAVAILERALKSVIEQPLSFDRELARHNLYWAICHQLEFSNREYRS